MKLHARIATRSEAHFSMLAAWLVILCLFTAGHAWASSTYIDNTSSTFATTGTWSAVSDAESYGGTHSASGVGAVTATWGLPATLPTGLYAVWANWPTSNSNGTGVTFQVHHTTNGTTTTITSKIVNQHDPDTALLFGNNSSASGNFLGVYCLDRALGNKIMLTHTAAVGNLAVADAIKLVPFFEATGGNLDISDAPLASQTPQAPANLLFVLDDSGSMDWEFLTTEADGTFSGSYYVFDNPGDNLYSGILPAADRGLYRSQWSGYNKLYYNPKQGYAPWPNQANANPNTPRSHPTSTVDTQTFTLGNTYLSVNSAVVGEVILDNADGAVYTYVDAANFSPGQVGTDGTPYAGNYYYSTVVGSWAKWTTTAPLPAGTYEVYARWPDAGSATQRDRTAGYEVFDGGAKLGATAILSQRYNANTWMSLGTKTFTGGIASVKLTRSNSQTRTLADAVRFLPTGAGSVIDIINAHYYTWNDLNSNGTRDAGEDIYLVNLTNPIAYYRFNDANSDSKVGNGELIPVAAGSVPATVLTYALPTAADAYTVERQNFANWYSFYRRRELAATASIARVISQLSEIRVGIYSINNRIIQPVLDVHVGASDSSTALLNTLYALRLQANSTPLRTGLNYAGRYFDKDDALVPGTIAAYPSPIASLANGGACQQNFTILMTDGYYNDTTPPSPGNTDGDNGAPFADGFSNTLADVAMLYYENDLADTIENRVAARSTYDNATWQHMVTYTVALGVTGTLNPDDYPASNNFKNVSGQYPVWPDPATSSQRKIDDMWHAAVNGRGDFVSASNPQELVDALIAMVGNISNRVGSEASLALNSEGLSGDLTTETRLYETTYLPTDWSGNVMAYTINPVTKRVGTSVWSARQKLKDFLLDGGTGTGYTKRAIATFNGATGIPFRWANLTTEQKAALNNEEPRLNYLRGDSSQEVQYGGALRNRIWRLGDIVNSMAVFEENTTTTASDDMLYVGANDGMLHAIDANTGEEIFAYVPNLVFNNLGSLTQPTYTHKFFVNGSPTIKTVKGTSYLIGGLLKGGKGYYCLDVSPLKIAAINIAPTAAAKETLLAAMVKWEYSGASCSTPDLDLGYGYSRPYLRKTNNRNVNLGQPIEGYMVFFGNGYSSPDGSAVLYVLDPLTGAVIRKIDTQSGPDNGLSSVTLVDVNGDLREDYAYAGDLKGNLWKFDLTSDNPANWSVAYKSGVLPEPVFRTPSPGQPITSEVDVMMAPAPKMYVSSGHGVSTKNPGYMVIFGTGRYLGLTDLSDTSRQSVYGIWDYGDDNDDSEYLGRFHSPTAGRLSNQPIGYTLAKQTVVYSGAELIALFTCTPTGPSVPGEVVFTDTSFGTITSWSWDFGDGGTSTVQSPSHIYTTTGTYTVTLTVTRTTPVPVLNSVETATVTVIHDYSGSVATDLNDNPALSPGEEILAYFEGHAFPAGPSGITVSFNNLSKGALGGVSYLWDFGDGSTSTAISPFHTYTVEGSFTVSLTAITPTATDTRTNSSYVTVMRPWIVNAVSPPVSTADYYSQMRATSDTMKECPSTAIWGTPQWDTDQNKCKWLASTGCTTPYTATSDTCVVHPYYYCTGMDLLAGQNKDPGPCPDDPETDITELFPAELPVYLGWYFDLPEAGERVVVDPLILSGNVEIISHVPQATMCSAEGYSWIMALDASTGGPPDEAVWDINRDNKITGADYVWVHGKKRAVTGVKYDRRVFRPGRVKDAEGGTSLLYFETGGGDVSGGPVGGDIGTGGGAAPLVGRLPRTGVVVWQEMP